MSAIAFRPEPDQSGFFLAHGQGRQEPKPRGSRRSGKNARLEQLHNVGRRSCLGRPRLLDRQIKIKVTFDFLGFGQCHLRFFLSGQSLRSAQTSFSHTSIFFCIGPIDPAREALEKISHSFIDLVSGEHPDSPHPTPPKDKSRVLIAHGPRAPNRRPRRGMLGPH